MREQLYGCTAGAQGTCNVMGLSSLLFQKSKQVLPGPCLSNNCPLQASTTTAIVQLGSPRLCSQAVF